jgi:triosephosphate isomerase
MNKLVIGNWKMNPQKKIDAEKIFKDISSSIKNIKNVDIVICPPFPFLFVKEKIKNIKIKLGSQDVYFEKEGSFTGEVSSLMLKNLGVTYIIIGHSERRLIGDTNSIINKKIITTLQSKMTPIFCVGENKRDINGFYLSYIKQQLEEGLKGVIKSQMKNIVFAYEPVWAIGSGSIRVAIPSEFIEIRIYIKKIIADMFDIKTANSVKIVYGGSVNPLNAESFIKEGGADGLLVGRDSLNPKKFCSIINLAFK